MSFLAPLFFAGIAAIGLPILFHLIRRRPKGEVEFSSLMFLQPTPPRLTRRSRLENLPLLLMRALALMLLAAAFTRPFFRSAAFSNDDNSGRRLMMLIDTSASMQRAGLWEQAKQKASAVIDDLTVGDQLSIVGFDDSAKTLLSYEQSIELDTEQLKSAARTAIENAEPTWHATNLGAALSYAADVAVTYAPEDQADEDTVASKASPKGPAHLILISDMQEGSDRESLQVYAWPKDLSLDVRRVASEQKTNASTQILGKDESGDADRIRVRVSNSADATTSRFRLAWTGGGQQQELPVQVPPGESRVVRMPTPSPDATALTLQGDDFSFDNQRYLVSPKRQALTLLFVGPALPQSANNDESRQSLLFYLQRVPWNNIRREVTVTQLSPAKLVTVPDVGAVPLVVVAEPISTDVAQRLKQYVAVGGKVLFVMSKESDADLSNTINEITGADLKASEAKVKDYVMFSRIDFAHPIFASMSDPQFNDFTKVKFWSHRKLESLPDEWKIAAEFDDGDPAIIQADIDEGKVWVLASGWQPSASQLALSTKFLPLMYNFFDTLGGEYDPFGSIVVGEPITESPSDNATLAGPDGMKMAYKTSADLDQISRPGIYTYSDGENTRTFAVNLADSESNTTAMDEDSLSRFGINLGEAKTVAQIKASERQLRDIELEKQQKVWQWLLVAALGFLGIETLWGGMISRTPRAATSE